MTWSEKPLCLSSTVRSFTPISGFPDDISPLLDEHTEELFVQHETELERLRAELKTKSRLLAAVKKYKEICEEELELEVRFFRKLCASRTDHCRLRHPIKLAYWAEGRAILAVC